jgi:16S rRNA (guanine527-N7)-methyltransferase
MDIILKYFPNLTSLQKSQISQLQELYAAWNARINVISRKDIDHLYERHVLHSMSIAKFFHFPDNSKIIDVGTGGGFPGIPLAILFPNCHFTLVDSIGKKITVVKEISNAVGLQNVTSVQERAEALKEKYHFVVSRAVTEFPQFVRWVKDKFEKDNIGELKNGIIYLKGGDLGAELKPFVNKVKIYDISSVFKEEFFQTKNVVYFVKC